MNDIDLIEDNLFLSNMYAANNLDLIRKHKIAAILTVADDVAINESVLSLVKWRRIVVDDHLSANLLQHF